MDQSSARRATIILGIVMIIAIGSSAVLPILNPSNTGQETPPPTATVAPTLPPTVTDFSGITFDRDYLHPSGLFSVGQPTGWTPGQAISQADKAEITMNNADLLSVIQVSVLIDPAPVQNMDALDARFTAEELNRSWSNYRSPRETARVREGDRLRIDFELKNARQQTFLARQISWYDQDWVYSLRVVTPENQIDLLKYMMDNLVASFKPNRVYAGSPADWKAYFDPTGSLIVRYPPTWTLSDSAPGRPASIEGQDTALRIERQSISAPLDEAGARAWVEASRPGVTISSVAPITRDEQAGFSVAYTYTDADGNPNSGLALLLNGPENALYVANLRLSEGGVDLNKDDAQVTHDQAVRVLGSFRILPGLNVPLPTPTPTITPTASPVPPTATPEATATAEATAAVESTAEATPESTPSS